MRRFLLPVITMVIFLTGCTSLQKKQQEKVVFVSILPLKYFTDKISGNSYRVEVMVPPGVGPETYSPTPKQMTAMASAGAYFATGHLAFEEAWLGNFKSVNPQLEIVNTSEGIELIGIEKEHGDHVHLNGIDPHTWSSPKAARIVSRNIFEGLAKIDPEKRAFFEQNLGKLLSEVDSVDRVVSELLSDLTTRKFLIFHPALGYYGRDYNLEQLSIEFEGKNPTPRHMQNIIGQVRSDNIKIILMQREFDKENAEVIAKETGVRIVDIDPLDYDWAGQMISIAKKLKAEDQ